ncbi:hypothetical protein AgCh_020808 [Apium graveolens]
MVAATEEVSRLSKANEKLDSEKQKFDLLLVELETVKQENEYLKNKLKCATKIEAVLSEKLEKNEVKLKSFRNASQLVGQYHEKNKPCANIAIGLDYDALNNNRKIEDDKGKATASEDVPAIKQQKFQNGIWQINFYREFNVKFDKGECLIISRKTSEVALKGVRKGNLFVVNLNSANEDGICCFYTKAYEEQRKMWHKKISHFNYKAINTLVKKELVRDMSNLEFAQNEVCEACQKGKMKKSSHKSKAVNSISAPLWLIDMD